MKRRKQILAAVLAAITLSQGMATFAKPATNNPDKSSDAHTTIGIVETSTDISQTQFEVPLYVTAAAVSNSDALLCPDGYDIKNTATGVGTNIGVLSMSVERLNGATWDIVHTAPANDKQVKLSIGGQLLPEVDRRNTTGKVDILKEKGDTAFYDTTTNKLRKIEPNKTLSEMKTSIAPDTANYTGLEIKGEIKKQARNDVATAAQFKVVYMVTPLDNNGDPIGKTYVGDVKSEAGLQ